MNAQQYQMMRVVQKIPVFKGFDVQEVLRLLRICHAAAYRPGQRIYTMGQSSDEMLIVLKGQLSVTGAGGEVLAMIDPGSATGEMGLFTGHPRSANIVAVQNSACLTIRKAELITLLSNNRETHVKLLYNLINLLSERLAQANRLNQQLIHDQDKSKEREDGDEEEEEADEEQDEDEEEGEEEEGGGGDDEEFPEAGDEEGPSDADER